MHCYRFDALLQQETWINTPYVEVDEHGIIQYIASTPPPYSTAVEVVSGYALPGLQNAHSHAFQYAMAGLAENHAKGLEDDFWTWREEMYKCALSLNPDQVESVAAMLYAEMVRQGYTHVAEFHYLHHDKKGKPFSNLAEMGERMVSAANTAGIKITLIPVFYQKGNFGQPPQDRQRRFISSTIDDYFKLLEASQNVVKSKANAWLGFSVHSLRAVEGKEIIQTVNQAPREWPFHIHVAEQKKEIEDCIKYYQKRPMEWLLENLEVNERYHLVHATHLNDDELIKLAQSKANVVLCPSTEGNLADGIFRMKEYVKMNGNWCIGTDSHVGLNPFEEFRMIDYRQRLITNKRNTFEGDAAHKMINKSVMCGRLSMGRKTNNHFEIGQPFDALVVSATSHLLSNTSEKNRMATLVYTSDSSRNIGTIINGKWVVKKQHHQNENRIKISFEKAMKLLKTR